MHKLEGSRGIKVVQFMVMTKSSEEISIEALKASTWNLKEAVDVFFLHELYKGYKDPDTDMILADSITLLCNDLQRFVEGGFWLLAKANELASTVLKFSFINAENFREIYNFAFGWGKEKGQKSLALDTAIGMWQLLFAEMQWPLVDHWCQFLQARHKKAISEHTWSQLLEFARTIDPVLSNYDAEGAWSYLIDEFVEYLNENGIIQNGESSDSTPKR